MSYSGLSPAAHIEGREPLTDETRVVHRRVPTNWSSVEAQQPSTEPFVASLSVPSEFLVEGQVSGRGLHPFRLKFL